MPGSKSLVCFMLLVLAPYADEEASNRPVVYSDIFGHFYVKSIPDDDFAQTAGKTYVYMTYGKYDTLVHTYNWYSRHLFVYSSFRDVYLIRLGPWQRSGLSMAEAFSVGFYKNGKKLKEYSALEIAGRPRNVRSSIGRYEEYKQLLGFRELKRSGRSFLVFAIRTWDDKILSFDFTTGKMLETRLKAGPDSLSAPFPTPMIEIDSTGN